MAPNDQALRNQIKEQFTEKLVSCFLEILVLAGFRDGSFSGYDALKFINERYGSRLVQEECTPLCTRWRGKGWLKVRTRREKGPTKSLTLENSLWKVTSSDEIQAFMEEVMRK
jgi:hypothetical protein